jgi:hypothetical protein
MRPLANIYRDDLEDDDEYTSDDGFVVPDGDISDSSSLKAERLFASRNVQGRGNETLGVDGESSFMVQRSDGMGSRQRITDELRIEDSFSSDQEDLDEGVVDKGIGVQQQLPDHRYAVEGARASKPEIDGFHSREKKQLGANSDRGLKASDRSNKKDKGPKRTGRSSAHVSREVLDLQPFSFDPDREVAKPGKIFEEVRSPLCQRSSEQEWSSFAV